MLALQLVRITELSLHFPLSFFGCLEMFCKRQLAKWDLSYVDNIIVKKLCLQQTYFCIRKKKFFFDKLLMNDMTEATIKHQS